MLPNIKQAQENHDFAGSQITAIKYSFEGFYDVVATKNKPNKKQTPDLLKVLEQSKYLFNGMIGCYPKRKLETD